MRLLTWLIRALRVPEQQPADRPPEAPRELGNHGSFQGALVATAVLAPTIAAVVTVGAAISHVDFTGFPPVFRSGIGVFLMHWHPLATATVVLLGVWAFLAWMFWVLGYSSARGSSTNSYDDVMAEVPELDAWITYMCPKEGDSLTQEQQTAFEEFKGQHAALGRECDASGPQWVSGTGYIGLWRRVHRAQQAMLELAPPASALKRAQYDFIRLKGSNIPGSETYKDLLLRSIEVLATPEQPGPGSVATVEGVPDGIALRTSVVENGAQDVGLLSTATLTEQAARTVIHNIASTGHIDQLPPPKTHQQATDLVRVAKRAIDEFRDDLRATLVRERGNLTLLIAFTTITGYALIWIAIAMQVSATSIGGGTVFFLVGALVGLIARLYSGETNVGVDDFGMSEAHLLAVPLLSGVAAVLGVTLVALGTTATVPASGPATPDVLVKAFDISQTSVNILIAAVFAFTPKTLFDRLTAKVDSYKQDLKSSEVSGLASAKPNK